MFFIIALILLRFSRSKEFGTDLPVICLLFIIQIYVLNFIRKPNSELLFKIGVFFTFLNVSNKNNLKPTSNNNLIEPNKEVDNQFVPIKTKNTFEGVSREEIFISKDRIPYQPIRYQFSDSFIWKNKSDGSVIEINVPSQRFFYVPIKTD